MANAWRWWRFEPGSEPDLSGFPITWTPLQALTSPEEAETSAPLHPNRPGNLLIEGRVRKGDAAAALAASAHVVEGTMTTGFVEHAYIEPEAGAAWMEGETSGDPRLHPGPGHGPRGYGGDPGAADGAGADHSLGGGRWVRLEARHFAAAADRAGHAEDRAALPDGLQPPGKHDLDHQAPPGRDAGADRLRCRGRITGVEFEGRFNTGAYSSWGPTVANRVPVHVSGPYLTPDITAKARAIHTHGPVSGAFRGFGVPQGALWQETLYDRLADKAGIDRLEFRILNALRDGDASATGQVLRATGIHDCLTALAPALDPRLAEAEGQPGRGVGVASCWYGCGNTALAEPLDHPHRAVAFR